MQEKKEIAEISAKIEETELYKQKIEPNSFFDYFSIGLTTCGVGYLPLAPGTFGSIVGVLIYIAIVSIEANSIQSFIDSGFEIASINAWFWVFNLILLLVFTLVGIRASGRAAKLFQNKDPQKVVVEIEEFNSVHVVDARVLKVIGVHDVRWGQ